MSRTAKLAEEDTHESGLNTSSKHLVSGDATHFEHLHVAPPHINYRLYKRRFVGIFGLVRSCHILPVTILNP